MARGGRRTYVRDSAGRFASTPGGGLGAARKASRSRSGRTSTLAARSSLKRSRAKLAAKDRADETLQGTLSTRAQKGAVTRGNRKLAGAKVAARTKLQGSLRAGMIGKSRKVQGGAAKAMPSDKPASKSNFRPGEFYRGNFRPRNVTGKPVKGENPWHQFAGRQHAERNLQAAAQWIRSQGVNAELVFIKKRRSIGSPIATASQNRNAISLNTKSSFWSTPRPATIMNRRQGFFSTSSPMHVLHHEMGHLKDKRLAFRWQEAINSSQSKAGRTKKYNSFTTAADWRLPASTRKKRGREIQLLAKRVSGYATTNPSEFIAETYAGRRTGRKYDYQVMDAYRESRGLPTLRLRNQKPLRRKPKPNP